MSYVGNKPPQTTIPADDSVTNAMLRDDAVTSAKIDDGTITSTDMAVDPRNASNLNAGDVPLAQLDNVDTSGIVSNQDDIALLGFKVAANGSLARYNLVDQSIDAFEDASGVDASASTNETRNAANYYSGAVAGTNPTGDGTVTTYSGYSVHTFLSTGDFIVNDSGNVDWLVVAGGGGGGGNHGQGGGAGGTRTAASQAVTARTYTVTVGSGGSGGGAPPSGGLNGSAGGVSSIAGADIPTYSASGGGYGAGDANTGGNGGSGGAGSGTGNAGGYSPVEGYAGGASDGGAGARAGGGGGGASEVGANASAPNGGDGGDGIQNAYRTGVNVYYGGGGGGGAYSGTKGSGGQGGGANGGEGSSSAPGSGASANTGGGAGGGGGGSSGGSGGTGIVVIRFADGAFDSYNNMTLVSNAQTAESAPTTGDLVMTISNGAGTTTPNTDIKAYISRDGSAYSSAVTLVDQGDTGGHTILTANGVDLSGITSGTSMRWKIETLNQSASKDTRIQAVSLGWS